MSDRVTRAVHSVVFYPLSSVYLATTLLFAAVVGGLLQIGFAMILFTLVIIGILLAATRRDVGTAHEEIGEVHHEVGTVHQLVNHQHDEMVATINRMSTRIGQLLRALHKAGVPVPDDDTGADDE